MIVSVVAVPRGERKRSMVTFDYLIAEPYRTLPHQREGHDFVRLIAMTQGWYRIGDRSTVWCG